MLSHFGRALRALAMTAALSAAIASAHEGHDHEQQPPVSAGAPPRAGSGFDAFTCDTPSIFETAFAPTLPSAPPPYR